MQLVSSQERNDWLRHRSLSVLPKGQVHYKDSPVHKFRLKLPTDGLQLIRLTNVLSAHIEGDAHPQTLSWIEEWNMWGADIEEMGRLYVEKLSVGFGVLFNIDQKTALLFTEAELLWQRAFIFLPMLFQWDAYFVPDHGNYVLFVSHDAFVEFSSRNADTAEKLKNLLQVWHPVVLPP